jgi:hypothetical protein
MYGSGYICAKCYVRVRREQLARDRNPGPSAAPITRRSHKRKQSDSEDGELPMEHDATTENGPDRRLRRDILHPCACTHSFRLHSCSCCCLFRVDRRVSAEAACDSSVRGHWPTHATGTRSHCSRTPRAAQGACPRSPLSLRHHSCSAPSSASRSHAHPSRHSASALLQREQSISSVGPLLSLTT